ncbi:hypothetical protein GCM10011414_05380 [Croceivirga lutea]|uniref:acyltransferase n=1 Tax=Croceivirga lutea TaxID=1775167 RepID=UPI001639D851|nr:acyltransferase [Croceivirga lutea]GGG38972.1 hypothetical protein GCM10011414_05380 [Croceivirga lutea]
MLAFLLPWYYKNYPRLLGLVVKLLFASKRIKVGKNFTCDSFPKLQVDSTASLVIGDNVQFRRNVEIRCHGNSKIKIGNNCRIDRGVRILSANESKIELQNECRIGLYSVFNGGDSITLGKNTLVSGYVYLQTSMHKYDGVGAIANQGYSHAPISLGKDCWLGTHAIIFPGVNLENGCVVGSSSVVNKSFSEKSIIAGIPGKLIKTRT